MVNTIWAWRWVNFPLVDLGPLLTLQLEAVTLVIPLERKIAARGSPQDLPCWTRGKKCTELFSHGFVLLSVLFLEHEPLETLQPMVRLLAAAVIEKDLLFVFKPFEVDTCIIFFCPAPYGVFPFNRTGFDSFFFFFVCSPYWFVWNCFVFEDTFLLLMYCLILLFSHTNFLLTYPRSTFDRWYVCYMLPDTYMLLLRFNSPNQLP